MIPSVDQLLAFSRSLEGESLTTLHRKKSFKVAVIGAALEITSPTGKPRKTDRSHIDELLKRLAKTGSFQPVQYKDLTFNASYLLAIVKLWQASHPLE
jgi:hypothetical protein